MERIISFSDLSQSIHGDANSWSQRGEASGDIVINDGSDDYCEEKSNSVDTVVKTNVTIDVRQLQRCTSDLHEEAYSTSTKSPENQSPVNQEGKQEDDEEDDEEKNDHSPESRSSMMSHYEEIHFRSSNHTLDKRSLSHGYEDIAPVDTEANGWSRPSLRTPSQSQNFFPSGDEEQPYENIVLNQSSSRGGPRDSPVGSHPNPNSPYYETMFGMARRFPSIRLTPNGKKSRKRKTSLAQSTTSSTEDFPRSGGNNISLDFETLDGLYSKPQKAGCRVDLARSNHLDSAVDVGDGSGSCVRPAHAIYDIVKGPSLASIRSYLSEKLSLNTTKTRPNSNQVSASSTQPTPNSPSRVTTDLPKSPNTVKNHLDGSSTCPWCLCVKSSQRRLNYQERSSESVGARSSCVSTPFLLIVIVLSIIIFIIAGAILIHQYLVGHAIWVSGNVTRAPNNQSSQESFRAQNQSETPQVGAPPAPPAPPQQSQRSSFHANTQGIPLLDHWDHWSSWSPCSSHCRQSGESQARSRSCLDSSGTIREDIKPCLAQGGLNIEIRRCLCNQSEAFQEPLRGGSSAGERLSVRAIRYCDHCTDNEACVALAADYFPVCRLVQDPGDPTGCGGLCSQREQLCHRLDSDAFREDEVGCDHILKQKAKAHGSRKESVLFQPGCPGSHLLCNDGETCLNSELFCNGVVDCPDESDEPDGCHGNEDHKDLDWLLRPNKRPAMSELEEQDLLEK
eukprot:TCALIF_00273-PA protein Name:"Protein of unknown function" AED:0.04 eAED:0.04 QI:0/0.66/0.5/0.9/1/1/10/140/731